MLVVGAGGGAGLACARAFARRGARLLLADVDPGALLQACRELDCHGLFCDVASEGSVAVFAADVERAYWPPDVLITAAGHSYVRTLGTMRVTRALLPLLKRGMASAHIVNFADPAVTVRQDCPFPYAASARAFEALSGALAEQLRGTGIRLTTIVSGPAVPRRSAPHHRWLHCPASGQAPLAERLAESLVDDRRRASRPAPGTALPHQRRQSA